MKTLMVIVTVALITTSIGAADIKLADATLGKTVHGPELTLNEMKGQVVLLTHWGAHCGTCVALLPEWQALYKKYNDQGLHVVGLEMDKLTDSEVDTLCKSRHVGFQVNVGGALMVGGHANWPHTFLFGADGKLLADNIEGKELEAKVKEALAEANSIDAGYGPYTKLAPLAAQVKAGQGLGQVLKTLAAKKSSKDTAEAAEATMMCDAVNGRADGMLKQALADSAAKPLPTIAKLEKLAQQFDGSEIGKSAKLEAEKLKSDPAVRKEIEANGMYNQLQTLCDGMKAVQGITSPKAEAYRRVNAQAIQAVVAGCQQLVQRYPGTKAATKAGEMMDEYR